MSSVLHFCRLHVIPTTKKAFEHLASNQNYTGAVKALGSDEFKALAESSKCSIDYRGDRLVLTVKARKQKPSTITLPKDEEGPDMAQAITASHIDQLNLSRNSSNASAGVSKRSQLPIPEWKRLRYPDEEAYTAANIVYNPDNKMGQTPSFRDVCDFQKGVMRKSVNSGNQSLPLRHREKTNKPTLDDIKSIAPIHRYGHTEFSDSLDRENDIEIISLLKKKNRLYTLRNAKLISYDTRTPEEMKTKPIRPFATEKEQEIYEKTLTSLERICKTYEEQLENLLKISDDDYWEATDPERERILNLKAQAQDPAKRKGLHESIPMDLEEAKLMSEMKIQKAKDSIEKLKKDYNASVETLRSFL